MCSGNCSKINISSAAEGHVLLEQVAEFSFFRLTAVNNNASFILVYRETLVTKILIS